MIKLQISKNLGDADNKVSLKTDLDDFDSRAYIAPTIRIEGDCCTLFYALMFFLSFYLFTFILTIYFSTLLFV